MAPRQLALGLVGLLLLQCRAEPARGNKGVTTTAAPPPLPEPLDLTRSIDASSELAKNVDKACLGFAAEASSSTWSRIEAPQRYYEHGYTVDRLPMQRLLAAGVLIDVADKAAHNASFNLTAKHVTDWEKTHGAIPKNSVVLVRFGWKNVTPEEKRPGISQEAALHLASQKRVVGVGVDLPSLEPPRDHAVAAALMSANIYILLNLDLTSQMPPKGFSLLVLPSKVRGANTTSVRVVATAQSGAPRPVVPSLTPLAAVVAVCISQLWMQL